MQIKLTKDDGNSAVLFFALKNGSITLFHPYILKNHPFSPIKTQTFTPKGCSGKEIVYDKI